MKISISIKTTLIICALFMMGQIGFAQKAFTFSAADANGHSSSSLDQVYKSGMHSDASLAVFKDYDTYIAAY